MIIIINIYFYYVFINIDATCCHSYKQSCVTTKIDSPVKWMISPLNKIPIKCAKRPINTEVSQTDNIENEHKRNKSMDIKKKYMLQKKYIESKSKKLK